MKSITAPILATLAVLYSLIVLISANPTPQPSFITSQDRTSDISSGLLEAMVLHRQQQSSGTASSAATRKPNRIMQVQQALKNDGFYSGPVNGVPSQATRKAIRSFQQARHLEVTGRLDDRTARELEIQ